MTDKRKTLRWNNDAPGWAFMWANGALRDSVCCIQQKSADRGCREVHGQALA